MAKNAKRNAADSFFAGAVEEFNGINTHNTHTQQPQTKSVGIDITKPYVETKSKRVNLVLRPSLYEKAQALAKAHGVSFNEMVAQILEQIVEPADKE